MAKRKSSSRKPATRRRRRGVGSINPSSLVQMIGGVIAGVAASGILNKTVLANKSPMVQALSLLLAVLP